MSDKKKHYYMGGDNQVVDKIIPTPATKEEIQAIIKGDDYDQLRIKAMQSSSYPAERESALKLVEQDIFALKQRDARPIPTTKIRPHEDRVIILPDKPITMTASGIVIPETVQEKEMPDTGVVIAVGPGRYINGILNPVNLKWGQRVYYGKYAGTMIEDKKTGEKYMIMRYGDIFARDEE